MNKIVFSSAVVLLAGCGNGQGPESSEPVGTSTEAETIGITLNGPPSGIDCISFTLESEDGTTRSAQFSLTGPPTLRIRNVTVGAYELTAVAYSSGQPAPISDAACAAIPLNSPWATEAPVPLVVQKGQPTQVSLTLMQTGRIFITPMFFDAPQVVAQGQGPVSFIAAAGSFVTWVVRKQDTVLGAVMGLNDGSGSPFLIASDQSNPFQILIDPATNTAYWENTPSLARDADGNFILDGSIWSSTGGELRTGLDPTDLGFASANSTFYWGERSSNSIECVPCATSFASGEPTANTLTALANHVFWSNSTPGSETIRAKDVTEATPRTLASVAPGLPYAMSADDQFLYFADAENGDINDTTIAKIPLAGGAVTQLSTHGGPAFPMTVFKGFVYYLDVAGVHRISVSGGPPEDVTTGSIGGFALTTDSSAHDVIYWTDTTHGGLVWRARLG